MSRCFNAMWSLLTTNLLAACLLGCSKSAPSGPPERTQIGQTNAFPLASLLSAESASESSIADLRAKAAPDLKKLLAHRKSQTN
jgi:hypothetical protein